MSDPRPEGIYPRWDSAWPDADITDTLLHVERVNGDGEVSVFECTRREAHPLALFLLDSFVSPID